MRRVTLRKTTHSVHPWRLGVEDGPQWWGLPHFTFARKRDAVAMLRDLERLAVDWSADPATWPQEHAAAVAVLQAQTPGWQVHQRGLAVWKETP